MNNVERFDELYNINTMTTQKGSFFRLQKILFENEELKELSLEAKVLYNTKMIMPFSALWSIIKDKRAEEEGKWIQMEQHGKNYKSSFFLRKKLRKARRG